MVTRARVDVFISSTSQDLETYRASVRDVVLSLGFFPVMMEYFPAMDADAVRACMEQVDRSRIYVGIFAHRYGYCPEGSDISITEMEFNRATDNKIPRFCFLIDSEFPWPPHHIEGEPGQSKLRDFKNKLNKSLVRATFRSPEGLALEVAKALQSVSPYMQKPLALFEIGREQVLSVTKPKSLPSEDTSAARARIQIILDGDDISKFDRATFLKSLSELTGVSPSEIQVLQVTKGSIRVEIELPEEAALQIYQMAVPSVSNVPTVQGSDDSQQFYEPKQTHQASAGRSTRIGDTVRGYVFVNQIDVGGFGAVYKAYQPNVSREVAIKIILPMYTNEPDFIRRFEVEAQLVARLEHMNIVPLYDYWRDENGAYLVMRWLRGGSLRGKLQQQELDIPFITRVLRQTAEALAFAHQHDVVHRDLKPDNILLDEVGNAFLSDFGIAKDLASVSPATKEGAMIGTPQYFSPEQFRSDKVTPLTDIYTLGLVLYEMLTGERPFGHLPLPELLYKHLNDPLPSVFTKRPDLSAAVDAVIQRATAKKPADRYPDPLIMAAAFEAAVRVSVSGVASQSEFVSVLTPIVSAIIVGKLKAKIYDRVDLILEKPRRLIGRDDLLSQIDPLLDQGDRVLLNGMGGMGKTSLAAMVAADWITTHKASVLWLEAANENAGTLFEALARALGEQQSIVNKSGDERIEIIRRILADRRMLFIIDNVWNDRALFEVMKATPPDLPVLITSRHEIPIDGAVIDVGELTPDKALDLLNLHARRNFIADTGAQDLCKALGNHPFTLEIAGKQMNINRHMTPEQFIENIKDAPHGLMLPESFAEPGRKGIQDLLDASIDELDKRSHDVFVQMGGLFSPVASFELLALVAGVDMENLKHILKNLDQRGLVELTSESEDVPSHYRLHDLTFSYARALFKEHVADNRAVIDAIRSYTDDHAEAFDILEFEQANILGGARAAGMSGDANSLIDMMTVLVVRGFMDRRGHNLPLLERLDDAIKAARSLVPLPESLHFLLGKRGNAYRDRGDLDNALKAYQEALSVAPNETRKAMALSAIGTVRFGQGAEDADTYLEQAYQIAKANNDDHALSVVLEHRGHQAMAKNEYETALRFFTEALAVAERLQNPDRLFFTLLNLGEPQRALKQTSDALANHERAYQLARNNDNHLWIANALQCIGEDYDALGEREKAQTNLATALEQFRDFGATERVSEMTRFMLERGYVTQPE